MTRGLSSKVRVVLSLLAALLPLTFACAQQNILDRKVSVHFLDVRFSEALLQIEKQANIHFIYSSNVIEPGRKVTYTGTNTSLANVFNHLGREMNLEFKTQNLYVIIKKGALIPAPPTLTISAPMIESIAKEDVVRTEPLAPTRTFAKNNSVDLSARIHREYLRKLDSLNLGNTLLSVNARAPKPHTKFYAAAGLYLSDFSGGVELQAGIKSIYGVLNAGLSEGKYLRMGFGVGTNIHLVGKFSVSPVYTFASLKQITRAGITTISEDGYAVSAQQHQLKLMLQYPVARNFSVKAGPSFNLMNLKFREQPDQHAKYTSRGQSRSYGGPQSSPDNDFSFVTNTQFNNTPSPTIGYDAIKSWVGFEAGIYYSLNFSKVR